ncbi:MAG: sigma-E processing peptidase SpoIIGA [Clostridia bacterium]|nr:sigma-E processing peptidase SpoIIGA [Clostridia bacterium]
MIVFIEYVLLDNLVIDYLLLKTTFAVLKMPINKMRLIFVSLFGAGFSLVYPLIQIHTFLLFLIKFLFGLLMVLLSRKFKNTKEYYVSAVIFLTLTFLTGGALIGIYNLLGLNYSSEISIAVMFIPAYTVLKIAKEVILYIYNRKNVVKYFYDVEIFAFNVAVKAQGFLDTGNLAYDDGFPIVFVTSKLCKKFFDGGMFPKLKAVTINTINGETRKLCFKCEKLVIINQGIENIFNNVTVCVTNKLSVGGAEVILHPALFEVDNVKSTQKETSKVS